MQCLSTEVLDKLSATIFPAKVFPATDDGYKPSTDIEQQMAKRYRSEENVWNRKKGPNYLLVTVA